MREGNGRFENGRSGNLKGRPKGARNRFTKLVEDSLEKDAPAIFKKNARMAKGGDLEAAGLVMRHVVPPFQGRPVGYGTDFARPLLSASPLSDAVVKTRWNRPY